MDYRATRLRSIALLIALGASCGHAARSSYINQNKPANVSNTQSGSDKLISQDANPLCNRIAEIKIFPMKGERGEDPIYDAFMDAGDKVVPCLIGKVTDPAKLRDPRQEPGFPDIEISVGDIAYFLLIDITKIHFTELLPSDVQEEYKDEGVYAYFKFVQKPGNREKLQTNLSQWYRRKYGKKISKS